MGGNGYIPVSDFSNWERLLDGEIDEAFKDNGNKPVAFDIENSPFSKIKVADYFQTSELTLERANNYLSGSPYNREDLLKEQIDGIIFFKPVEDYSGATVYDKFFDDNFMEKIEMRTDGKIKTRKQLYEIMKSQRPILSTGLDVLISK